MRCRFPTSFMFWQGKSAQPEGLGFIHQIERAADATEYAEREHIDI